MKAPARKTYFHLIGESRLAWIAGLTALAGAAHAAAQPATAPQRVEALLAAMGGREVWAKAKFVHVQATHHEFSIRAPFANQIWNDFTAPRVRIEATIDGDPRKRGLAGDQGWRVRDGQRHALTPEQLLAEQRWWESNVYRTLHRLAVNDPALTARAVGADRLEIVRADGTRLNWFQLNARGEPVRFGTWDSETGSIFGPLAAEPSGLRHPKWGTSADGSFRFEITGFHPAASVPAAVKFHEP